MKRFIYKASLLALPLAIPAFALAATSGASSGDFTSLNSSITAIENLINKVVPLIIGIAGLVFIWGLVSYVTAGGDEEKKKTARDTMVYGIIVLFVMVSVWGLVNILVGTFGLNNATSPAPTNFIPTNQYFLLEAFLYKVNNAIVNPLIYLMMAVALVSFLWGVAQYVNKGDNEDSRAEGSRHMLWGIVGLFIMFGVFGIIHIILNTFGISDPNVNVFIKQSGDQKGN